MKVLEELFMLEQRILCKLLPKSFDHITLHDLDLTKDRAYMELSLNEKQKKLQQLKRTMLDRLIQVYENKIVDYEHQYQQEFNKFEMICSSHQRVNEISLVDSIKTFMSYRTDQIKRINRYKMAFIRSRLFRRRRLISTKNQHIVGVWPQTIVHVSTLPLNEKELAYLSSAGICQ